MDQIQRPMETVLMVAEKPSIAKTIANALAGGRFLTRKGWEHANHSNDLGDSKYCPVHEFEGTLFGAAVNIRVTSVTGHIFTRDFEA
jgi:DNA topoisomerase-3